MTEITVTLADSGVHRLPEGISAGDDVDVEIRNVAGVVSYVAVQIDYEVETS